MTQAFLLPGMHGTDALWPRFRAAWDALPGDAESSSHAAPLASIAYPDDPSLALDGYIAYVEASIAARTADPVDLIAESFSGPIALRVAQRGRVRVRRLVLVASFAAALRPGMFALARWLPKAWVARVLWFYCPNMLLNGIDDEDPLQDDVGKAVLAIPPTVVFSRMHLMTHLDAAALLISCPVLYLQARYDNLVPAKVLTVIRHCCPDLTVMPIAAPHLVLQCAPKVSATAIRTFLAQ